MEDVVFYDAGFNATEVGAEAVSEKGRAFFAERYGPFATAVILRKSGAYDLMDKLVGDGFTYKVVEEAYEYA